jgi:hypothetical protein
LDIICCRLALKASGCALHGTTAGERLQALAEVSLKERENFFFKILCCLLATCNCSHRCSAWAHTLGPHARKVRLGEKENFVCKILCCPHIHQS